MSGGFLERWSQRKGTEAQTREEPDKAATAPEAEPEPDPPPALNEEELAALPRIEDLTPESSLAPFLRAGVPSSLKNAAMRRMWLLTPAIRDHNDCAVDYHWDWNTPGGVPGAGGRLEPQAVKKMLSGLTEPRPRAIAETQDGPKPDAEAQTSPEARAQAPVSALTDAETETESTIVSVPVSTQNPSELPQTGQRKRHGGAMPC